MSKERKHGNKEVKKPKQAQAPVAKPGTPAQAIPAIAPATPDRQRKR
ncbi:hypothetical protein [Rhizobacter sp. SG703]|nr:hypothetical protein [Rhizobacter sp. SG703]NKI97573.1 hypothetical protein [Rhizobacter sp. SG703]